MSEKAKLDKSTVYFAFPIAAIFLATLDQRRQNALARSGDAHLTEELTEREDELGALITELAMLDGNVRSRDTQSLDHALSVLDSVLVLMQTEESRADLCDFSRGVLLQQIDAVQKALSALKIVRFPSQPERIRQRTSFLRTIFRDYWLSFIPVLIFFGLLAVLEVWRIVSSR